MIYIITSGSGKDFISGKTAFTFKCYIGNVISLDDSKSAKTWADQQVLFNGGLIVDKSTAQSAIDTAYDSRDKNIIDRLPTGDKPIL